jgi:hypothetical protein
MLSERPKFEDHGKEVGETPLDDCCTTSSRQDCRSSASDSGTDQRDSERTETEDHRSEKAAYK